MHVVDVFCGCGGFGLGAELAGFKTFAAVDIDETLQSAYKYNFPNTNVINGDLGKMDENSWALILQNREIDGVIGGPPCQGFSRMGKSDPKDPRRSLLQHFFRHINIIRPKFFVMENVEGLMDCKNVGGLYEALKTLDNSYTVLKPMIIDASKFGTPTKRSRVIVVGFDANKMPKLCEKDFYPQENTPITTVKEAISDLPEPLEKNSSKNDFGWKKYRKNKNISQYAKVMRQPPPHGLGNPTSIKMLEAGKSSGHFNTIHSEPVQNRYANTPPGETDPVSRSKRLEWGGLCPTLRAGTGSDKGSHQAVRPLHPESPRVITVREAARLQGFPDWFCFHPAKWHSFRMIGNSVSPIVGHMILRTIRTKIEAFENNFDINEA